MYKVVKILNNNVVCSLDHNGEEVILRGLGIGFQKKINDEIDEDKIEKVYKISNNKTSNKLQELLAEIPNSYAATSSDIIDYAKETLGKKLNDNIYITLTDHISFALDRKDKNLEYKNVLLSEIRQFYPSEFAVGTESLKIIKEKLGVDLSLDEAGFIALHIVNAELDTDMSSMFNITKLIQKIIDIVKDYYKISLDEESLNYARFITHLKFFGQRVFNNKISKDDDVTFQKMVRDRYAHDYQCAVKIREYVEETYKKTISEEEMTFLTVHLKRISIID